MADPPYSKSGKIHRGAFQGMRAAEQYGRTCCGLLRTGQPAPRAVRVLGATQGWRLTCAQSSGRRSASSELGADFARKAKLKKG
jgi:hypothetical protein